MSIIFLAGGFPKEIGKDTSLSSEINLLGENAKSMQPDSKERTIPMSEKSWHKEALVSASGRYYILLKSGSGSQF